MNENFKKPITLSHQGKAILFAAKEETGQKIYYNILDLKVNSQNDNQDWLGYRELSYPETLSGAGFNLMDLEYIPETGGFFQVVTDQVYIYLFRSTGQAIYGNRYMMVRIPNPKIKGETLYELQPAWQVRFRGSGNVNLPAGDKDTQGFLDPDDTPFVEPVYIIPFGEKTGMNMSESGFTVLLTPTNNSTTRWQFIIPDPGTGKIHLYSFSRDDTGWFIIDDTQLDREKKIIKPDLILGLSREKVPLAFTGPPAAAVYMKQEPLLTSEDTVLRMQQTGRLLLAAETSTPEDEKILATIDFGISDEGRPAFTDNEDETLELDFETGRVLPAAYSAEFNNRAWISLPDGIAIETSFSLQAWIHPSARDLDDHALINGAPGVDPKDLPPSMGVTSKQRIWIAFGDGTSSFRAESAENVASLSGWTQVTAVFDGTALKLYINGSETGLTGDTTPGASPAGTYIKAIGGQSSFMSGYIDEVRIWDKALSPGEIREFLYKEIPDDTAREEKHLIGYWRLNDGKGLTARDFSSYERDGTLVGVKWQTSNAPLQQETQAIGYYDKKGLSLFAGFITPTEEWPDFGRIHPGSRPWIVSGGDGLVHLYYQGVDNQFQVIRYDPTESRAIYRVPWNAEADDPSGSESGDLLFGARQVGSYFNHSLIEIATNASNSLLVDITMEAAAAGNSLRFTPGEGGKETWKGIPNILKPLLRILGGETTSEPSDPRLLNDTVAFFDYTGKRYQSFHIIGDALKKNHFQFISRHLDDFILTQVTAEEKDENFCDVRLRATTTKDHPGEEIIGLLKNVPRHAGSFINVMRGIDDSYDYSWQTNAEDKSTRFYTLPAGSKNLIIFIPDTTVLGAEFEVSGAGKKSDPGVCTLHINLTLGDTSVVQATWEDIPRETSSFIGTLLSSTEPDQVKVVGYLRFWNAAPAQLVENTLVNQEADVRIFTSLLVIMNHGVTTNVPDFTATLSPLQSAVAELKNADLKKGSNLFAVLSKDTPSNGYPGSVPPGSTPGQITLAASGSDGGWTAESPRYAVAVEDTSNLVVNPENQSSSRLSFPGAMTMEAWARINFPDRVWDDKTLPGNAEPSYQRDAEPSFPRIIHGNPGGEPDTSRYFLGLAATDTLQFVKGTRISIDDTKVPQSQEHLRLFYGTSYTIQFYLLPDIDTIDEPGRIFIKESTDSQVSEILYLVPQGDRPHMEGLLKFIVTPKEGDPVTVFSSHTIKTGKWSQITLARSETEVLLYINGKLDSIHTVPPVKSEHHRLTLGDKGGTLELEMEVNLVCVWNRQLSQEEVASNYLTYLPNDDDAFVLKWAMDDRADGNRIINTALLTGPVYDTTVSSEFIWDSPGIFFRGIAGVRQGAARTKDAVIAPDVWRHYSAMYSPHYSISLTGKEFCDCGNDTSLNIKEDFTIESWLVHRRRTPGTSQVIVSKFGPAGSDQSWEFGLDGEARPYIKLRLIEEGKQTSPASFLNQTFTAGEILTLDKKYSIVAGIRFWSVGDYGRNGLFSTRRDYYGISGQIYINGIPQIEGPETVSPVPPGDDYYLLSVIGGKGSGWYKEGEEVSIEAHNKVAFKAWRGEVKMNVNDKYKPKISIRMPDKNEVLLAMSSIKRISLKKSETNLNIGRTQTGEKNNGRNYFFGDLSDIRLWNISLEPAVVEEIFNNQGNLDETNGLVSAWYFREQQGRTAYDDESNNNALLSTSTLWSLFHDNATLQFFLDGEPVPSEYVFYASLGSYGRDQVRFGAMSNENNRLINPLDGSIDEIRLWNEVRTREQITDNMSRYLVGNESYLSAYWRFDLGSGDVVNDQTGFGNDALFSPSNSGIFPSWISSSAPVNDEAPPVVDALGGLPTHQSAFIDEGPAVVEYGDAQTDSRGELVSVLKRAYIYHSAKTLIIYSGYKIGDLKKIFIGQIQTKPTLVGYVEGVPPLPSENLTRPFYEHPTNTAYLAYDNIASVTLTEGKTENISFITSRSKGEHLAFEAAAGIAPDVKVEDVIGAPPVQTTIMKLKKSGKFGVGGGVEYNKDGTEGHGLSTHLEKTITHSMSNAGDWERPGSNGQYFLHSGERRYLPSSEGYALVKSLTADLYSFHLKSTGALVSLVAVPNPDIPEDVNLIYFPLSPSYVKNGCLDGRVGLQKDPETDVSYFRPVEAYSLKRKIEKQEKSLCSYYDQFDAEARGKAHDENMDKERENNPYFDWKKKLPRKDMVNTYVWTAAGGLYKEKSGYVNSKQESHGGSYYFSWKAGFSAELSLSFYVVGPFFQVSLFGGTHFSVVVEKNWEEEHSLSLEVSAGPEGYLNKYLGPGENPAYSADPVPGKIDLYRFMTFYLSPRKENNKDFFNKVVDKVWLRTSGDQRAAALLEAEANGGDNSVWRILHRVTFVSRIPPRFQSYPVNTSVAGTSEPANMVQNKFFMELVAAALDGSKKPTPLQIGEAVRKVVLEDFLQFIPWWADFKTRAEVPNSRENKELAGIIEGAITYMNHYYETV